MTMLWILIALGAVGAVIALRVSRSRDGAPHADLGTVSSQWISEHRLGANQDSRR